MVKSASLTNYIVFFDAVLIPVLAFLIPVFGIFNTGSTAVVPVFNTGIECPIHNTL